MNFYLKNVLKTYIKCYVYIIYQLILPILYMCVYSQNIFAFFNFVLCVINWCMYLFILDELDRERSSERKQFKC